MTQYYYSCVSVTVDLGITVLVELLILGGLVLVLIFWFRIIKCRWFYMLGIIASNFLKTGNGWTMVEKFAATVGTHFLP